VLDRVNRRDGFSMKKLLHSSARGASFHIKHAVNANVVRVVLLDANSYLVVLLVPSADCWVLKSANAAETNGLTCLPKHGRARDNKLLVSHSMSDQRLSTLLYVVVDAFAVFIMMY
jgi:hypothetical protein